MANLEVDVRVSRREVLISAALAPIGAAVGAIVSTAGQVVARSAPSLRPPAVGTSASRCAACGGSDHTMLDARCPAARRVR